MAPNATTLIYYVQRYLGHKAKSSPLVVLPTSLTSQPLVFLSWQEIPYKKNN
jgi:hypothetical protein